VSEERHVLVIANETVAGKSLIDALKRRSEQGPLRVTVITPVNQPREGYVVYDWLTHLLGALLGSMSEPDDGAEDGDDES